MYKKKVCILGAGITGLALHNTLSGKSIKADIIDRNPYPGGQAAFYGCKATASCVQCGVCLVREALQQVKTQPGAGLFLSAKPLAITRQPDNRFRVELAIAPNGIDWHRCTGCSMCVPVCPEQAITAWTPGKYRITEKCTECGKCIAVCPVNAIALKQPVTRQEVNADALVLATGFTPFNPAANRKWGYHAGKRIISGQELEWLFYTEEYLPVKDAERIAFIQCVGSRSSKEGNGKCSRVCCAYALRMADRLKKEFPALQIDIYYMDIQQFGKNFENFSTRVAEHCNFIRSIPVCVENDASGKPLVRRDDMDSAGCRTQSYDLVVLSQGLAAAEEGKELAQLLGIDIDADGFFRDTGNANMESSHPGVFVAGSCRMPMRIDECVADAAAVSARVLSYLGEIL